MTRTSDSSRTFVDDRLLASDDSFTTASATLNAVAATDDSLIAAASIMNNGVAAATDDSLIAAAGTMNAVAASATDDSLIAAGGTLNAVAASSTDDSLIASAGIINTVAIAATDDSLLAAAESNAMAASLDRLTVETDDMKRESGGEASPVSQGKSLVALLVFHHFDLVIKMNESHNNQRTLNCSIIPSSGAMILASKLTQFILSNFEDDDCVFVISL